VLRQVYARTLRESACHLVTLVGEPGIGKSRLVAELREHVDAQHELVHWRQGRCLPYGEGIALWSLGEIVKAQAGIRESDDPATTREKLAAAVEPLFESTAERAWIEGELARLVGAAEGEAAASREESFAAWRAFLEAIAAQRPLLVVIEDLHWADRTLLDFVEHLVGWATAVPLVVLCTARPELHELHPAWSGGTRNATTISLSPLSNDDTARLIGALLERSVLPADTQQRLLERAGGNPLYAEQFVQMLRERPDDDVPVPETLQALIAARLDTLSPERKGVLQDAAVVGKVFWTGALAAVGSLDEREVRDALHELVRRDLVRPSRRSSVEGQAEFAFGHGLVRDVAYAQIPRTVRVRKHETAAGWIEQIAGDRVADYAELLAHHYGEALALARAAGVASTEQEDRVRRFLILAGERASGVDIGRATAFFQTALDLTPPGHLERGRLLATYAEAAEAGFSVDEVTALLDETLAELRAAGDERGTAKVRILQSRHAWYTGDSAAAAEFLDAAVELLERHEPGSELADAYTLAAGQAAIAGEARAALEWAGKGIELAERIGSARFAARGRQMRGMARCDLGDYGGLEDMKDSLQASLEAGWTRETSTGFNNYASWLWLTAGGEAALPVYRDGIEFARRRGASRPETWTIAESTWALFDLGLWDELLEAVERIEVNAAEQGAGKSLLIGLTSKARVLFYRGAVAEAREIAADVMSRARAAADPQIVVPGLSLAMIVEDDPARVRALGEELLPVDFITDPETVRACIRVGALDIAERLTDVPERASPRTRHAAVAARAQLAEARGNREAAGRGYAEAAALWLDYPFVLERALALVGVARTTGDDASALEATELLRSLGAHGLASEAAAAAA
jgi:tetratricopeptide (TPR) repeat protein